MRRFLTLIAAVVMVNACTTTDNLRPKEAGVWIPVRNTSYSKVFAAADKVMASHLHVVHSDKEIGTVKGVTSANAYFWKEAAGIYVWPTISNDYGYFVYVDNSSSSLWFEPQQDWKKKIIEDLKKELGVI
jgi:hypothetical protein